MFGFGIKKSVYIVNNEEKTLDEINEELLEIDREKINITLVDKYASAKAWEEIIDYLKTNGFNYGEK